MRPRRHGISWEAEEGSLGREAPLVAAGIWLSSAAPLHPALGWASSLPSGGGNISV